MFAAMSMTQANMSDFAILKLSITCINIALMVALSCRAASCTQVPGFLRFAGLPPSFAQLYPGSLIGVV